MRAAISHRYGSPDELVIGEMADPVPGRGEVLVRVRAASVNPLDTKLRAGALRPLLRLRFPAVLGFDFAGEVEATGPGVTDWAAGDRVYGRTDAKTGGTHAELAGVSSRVIDRIPASLSFDEAASLPLAAMTAIQAFERAGLRAGHRLLVNGAAGGVGSAAVQVGRALGASVTGVSSGDGAAIVTRLGARKVDYTKGELSRLDETFDVIFDTVFNQPSEDLARLLDERGSYITTGFSPGLLMRAAIGRLKSRQRFGFVASRADGRLMRRLSEFVDAGQMTAVIDSKFPLARIADAHRRVESGHCHGKVVVTIPRL